MKLVPEHGRTEFLDGVRGWASVVVVFSHLIPLFLARTTPVYQHWLLIFPTDGNLAVYVFFVLSGFALSIGFIQSNNDYRILTSLALRRYPRLTLPILASCLLAYGLHAAGLLYNHKAAALANSQDWLDTFYRFNPSLSHALQFSLSDVFFKYQWKTSYNAVLWTMPVEFLGSMFVFGFCALFLRFPKTPLMVGTLTFLMIAMRSQYAPFMIGIALALFFQSDLRRRIEGHWLVTALGLALIASVGVYSTARWGGFSEVPEMRDVFHSNPTRNTIAAGFIVLAITASYRLRQLFETRLSKYLGSLSFPLYLTHLLVICSFSSYLFLQFMDRGLSSDTWKHVILLASLAVCWFVAHFFRYVEYGAIKFSRRVSKALMGSRKPLPEADQ